MIKTDSVYKKINGIRKKKGGADLVWNEDLSVAALVRAKEIFESKNWSHNREGGKFNTVLPSGGAELGFNLVGENLARKFKDEQRLIRAWYKSPLHKRNMLQDFTDTGIATYGDVTVQLFGRKPAPKTPQKP